MVCVLCNTVLSTHNCGNAKKHLRYKHPLEFLEIQAMDIQSKSAGKRKHQKTAAASSNQKMTLDQISAMLMLKNDSAGEETTYLQTEPELTSLQKSIKM